MSADRWRSLMASQVVSCDSLTYSNRSRAYFFLPLRRTITVSLARSAGGEPRVDAVDAAVVDVGAALLDGAAGVALALGQAGCDQGVDDRQAAVVGKRVAASCLLGTSAKICAELRVVQVRRSRRRRRSPSPAGPRPGPRRRGPAASAPRPGAAGCRACAASAARAASSASISSCGSSVSIRRHLPTSASSTLIQY